MCEEKQWYWFWMRKRRRWGRAQEPDGASSHLWDDLLSADRLCFSDLETKLKTFTSLERTASEKLDSSVLHVDLSCHLVFIAVMGLWFSLFAEPSAVTVSEKKRANSSFSIINRTENKGLFGVSSVLILNRLWLSEEHPELLLSHVWKQTF